MQSYSSLLISGSPGQLCIVLYCNHLNHLNIGTSALKNILQLPSYEWRSSFLFASCTQEKFLLWISYFKWFTG